MIATTLAHLATTPLQVREWAEHAEAESRGRRAIRRRYRRLRPVESWRWDRVGLVVTPWVLFGMLYYATGPTP